MLTADQISQNIITQLRILDPAISAEVGTPERKVIDTVAEQLAAVQVDFSVLDAQNDLTTMSGGRLDAYLGNFGFARQASIASTGTVTFSRTAPATADILVPQGTQVVATSSDPTFPDLTFVTTDTVTLAQGTLSIDALVQCSTPGTVGNVPAGAVHDFTALQSIIGITTVTNAAAMTGGTDGESDADYKVRFQNTVFRNMSGTYDQFMALAVALNTITKANVIGPLSRYQEYIQVPTSNDSQQDTITITDTNHSYSSSAGGYDQSGTTWPHKRTTVASTIPYSKYAYDQQYYVTDGNLGASATFLRPFVDYVFNRVPITTAEAIATTPAANNQPDVTFLKTLPTDSDANPIVTEGAVLLMEHGYISKNSRNDYYKGIMNCVDIFVNGDNDTSASSQEVVPGNSNLVQTSDNTQWTYQSNFIRNIDSTLPTTNNKLIPLYWQPVTSMPDILKISDGSTTYTFYRAKYKIGGQYYYDLNADGSGKTIANFFDVTEVTGYYGTLRARNGLALRDTVNGYLPNGTQGTKPPTDASFIGQQFSITNYTYDKNISDLQAIVESNKQITTDVLVHKSTLRYFRVNVTIMYSPGSTQSVVNASIAAALDVFFDNQFYGAAIQLSDILQTIHNVVGVDNVRFTFDSDSSVHKVEETLADGSARGNTGGNNRAGSTGTSNTYFDTDFFIADNELAASPSANPVVIVVRGQGTWGT